MTDPGVNGRSPVRYSPAKRFQNNPLYNGNHPNLEGGGAGKRWLAMACLPRFTGQINPSRSDKTW